MIIAPISGESGPLGALEVYSRSAGRVRRRRRRRHPLARRPGRDRDHERAPDRGAEPSRRDIGRRAEAERSLREIAARITAIRDTADLLQHVADEAARLLGSDGAIIDLLDPISGTISMGYVGGLDDERSRRWETTRVGEDIVRRTIAGRAPLYTIDYLGDPRFAPRRPRRGRRERDRAAGDRDRAARLGAGGARHAGRLLVDARHVRAGRREPARRPGRPGGDRDAERPPDRRARAIAARARGAGGDRALAARHRRADHVARRPGRAPRPRRRGVAPAPRLGRCPPHPDVRRRHVPRARSSSRAGWTTTPRTGSRACSSRSAAGSTASPREEVRPIWTYDYANDPRIPHEPDDDMAAERLQLRALAAAPLRAPAGEVIGTLAVSYATPREILPDELDLLQGLADQAAIALTNANLYELLGESEARYRNLVQNSPDLVWSIGADARFTFVSDSTSRRLTGWARRRAAREAFRRARPRVVARGRRDRLDAPARRGRRDSAAASSAAGSTSSTRTATRSRPSSSPSRPATRRAGSPVRTAASAT